MTYQKPPLHTRNRVVLTPLAARIIWSVVVSLVFLFSPHSPVAAQEAADKPVVVELFTSQGCSSCPPADAFLGDLAKQPGVIALAYHVDYWNRLGWVDPFSSEWATRLQTSYSRAQNRQNNYTPQMIVQGSKDLIGSRRKTVLKEIDAHQGQDFRRVAVTIAPRSDGRVEVAIGTLDRQVEADVILMRFHRHKQQQIGRGENGGRTLNYHNIVHERRVVGRWRGDAETFAVPAPKDLANTGLAVIVQERNHGPIVGAAQLAHLTN